MTRRLRTAAVGVIVIAWAAAVGAGFSRLWTYAATPGPAATTSAHWPGGTSLTRRAGMPTLVLFLHPFCGCSDATVDELARLVAQVHGRVDVHVLMYRPSYAVPGWESTDLWDAAAAIPGVHVWSDEDAAQTAVFGAFVSGQTLLFDASGTLVFDGGITYARGHAGDNEGRAAIQSFLLHGTAPTRQTPVFGCFLRTPVAA